MTERKGCNEAIGIDLNHAVGMLFLTVCGCANVKQVTVDPPVSCPGDVVSLAWQATGTTRLFQVPLAPGQSDQCLDTLIAERTPTPVNSAGENRQPVLQSTVFYIEARGLLGKAAHRCATAFVNTALPLAGLAQCAGPQHAGIEVARPADARWSERVRVGAVQNTNEVTVTVRHGGVSETLDPGAASSAFADSDANGSWMIDYALPAGPDCGQPGAHVPASLGILVLPHCGPNR